VLPDRLDCRFETQGIGHLWKCVLRLASRRFVQDGNICVYTASGKCVGLEQSAPVCKAGRFSHILPICEEKTPFGLFCGFMCFWFVWHLTAQRLLQWSKSLLFFLWCCAPTRARASSFLRVLHHTQLHTPVARTPLDEWSARRRDLYLTTHNTQNRET